MAEIAALPAVRTHLANIGFSAAAGSPQQLQQTVRRTIGPWVGRKLRRKPMIVPVVLEADRS